MTTITAAAALVAGITIANAQGTPGASGSGMRAPDATSPNAPADLKEEKREKDGAK